MSIESLKEQARRHEQNEEWRDALDLYRTALAELARDEQVDIGLYNRVGDLYVRIGELEDAIEHYERAVDLYREAFLPNNAIAVCKKIIRSVPNHHEAYLKIGQIRAEQGFLPDARTNFLTYAERMQKAGHLDESFRALIEFCDVAPDDVGVRITVAEQMAASGRTDEAVEQLLTARQHLARKGDPEEIARVEEQIRAIDPEVDLSKPPTVETFGEAPVTRDDDILSDFGEITFGEPAAVPDDLRDAAEQFVVSASEPESQAPDEQSPGEDDEFEFRIGATAQQEETDETEAPELPMLSFEEEGDEESEPLPTFQFDESETEEEAQPSPTFSEAEDEETLPEIPTLSLDEEEHPVESEAGRAVQDAVEEAASEPSLEPPTLTPPAPVPPPAEPEATRPPAVVRLPSDETVVPPPHAPTEPAEASDGTGPAGRDSDEPDGGYVDLGAMILGSSGRDERSTRFTIAYEEPSGDEEADFARMLHQFKEKVSENLDSGDVRAHYDLGTAYKEMGLLDEAITSFQAALRASTHHLPTYEVMGQTFIDMGQPDAAVRTLRRAIEANPGVEDELVGIYYYLARAYEALENRTAALEFYDRVFALDINFADVTERLRALR